MFFKIFTAKKGEYEDENGVQYNLVGCNNAHTPNGLNTGWTEYKDEAEAIKGFGLTKIKEEFEEI